MILELTDEKAKELEDLCAEKGKALTDFVRKLPPWYAREGYDSATLDFGDMKAGLKVRIGDASMRNAFRVKPYLPKTKDDGTQTPLDVTPELLTTMVVAHVRAIDGEVEGIFHGPLIENHANTEPARLLGWVQGSKEKAIDRLLHGIFLFRGDAGRSVQEGN